MHRRALLSITTPSSLPIHHTYVCFTAFLCCRSLLLGSTPSIHTHTHTHTHTHLTLPLSLHQHTAPHIQPLSYTHTHTHKGKHIIISKESDRQSRHMHKHTFPYTHC